MSVLYSESFENVGEKKNPKLFERLFNTIFKIFKNINTRFTLEQKSDVIRKSIT